MRKIKFFSFLSIMLFLFSLVSIIGAKADSEYVFEACSDSGVAGSATVENNVVTHNVGKAMVETSVSNVDLTGDVYISIQVESKIKNFDIFANHYSESSARLAYKVEERTVGENDSYAYLTEYTLSDNNLIVTCKVDEKLEELGITEVTKVLIWLRGSTGDVVEILDFAITTDGVHGFDPNAKAGENIVEPEEPETPVEPGETPEVNPNRPKYVFSADYAMKGENNLFTMESSESFIITSTSDIDLNSTYVSIKLRGTQDKNYNYDLYAFGTGVAEYVKVAYKPQNQASYFTEYQVYGTGDDKFVIITAKIDSYESDGNSCGIKEAGITELTHLKFKFRGAAGDSIEVLDFAITTDGKHGFDTTVSGGTTEPETPVEPVGPVVLNDITLSSSNPSTIEKNENNEQVIKYSTSPGWSEFIIDVQNYNSTLDTFEIKFTVNESVEMFYKINGVENWTIGYKTYEVGTHTELVALTPDLPKDFTIALLMDANKEVTSEKVVTVHSYSIYTKVVEPEPEPEPEPVYDPTQPTTYSDIVTSADATITKNENNEQVITYSKKPGFHGFDFTVTNYNPEYTEFEFIYSANTSFTLCVAVNDKYEGHISYPAGTNRVIRLDFSDAEKYNLGVNFTVNMFFDASTEVSLEKVITVHSYQYKTPEPLPEGMLIKEPQAEAIECIPNANNGWDISYDNANPVWRNIKFDIVNYEATYDVLRIKLALTEGTNLGIRIHYKDETGTYHKDLRRHDAIEGVAQATGEYDLVFLLAAYGLENVEVTSVQLYFDNPTDYTTNTGAATATVHSFELLESSSLELGELEFTLEDTVVTYNGLTPELNIVCDEDVTFVIEHSAPNTDKWYAGVPTNAGEYVIRVKYMGSLKYNYKNITANLTINKLQAVINANDVTVDQETGEVTVANGVVASTSPEFEASNEVVTGDVVEFDTTIYYYIPGNSNIIESEVLSLVYEMSLEQYQNAAILVLTASIDEYPIDITEYVNDVKAAQTKEAVDEIVNEAIVEIENKKAEIDATNALASKQVAAKKALDEYKAASLYREAEQETLASAIEAGKAEIDAAETESEVETALAAAKTVIDAIKTKAQYEAEEEALATAKANAKTTLAAYKSADLYREAEQALLASAITDGNTAIEAAATTEEIDTALAAAKTEIDAIKTKSAYEAEESAAKALADAKTNAINEVNAAIGQYEISSTEYETAINAAETVEAVATAKQSALSSVATKKSEIDAAAAAAKALADAKTAAKQEIATAIGSYAIDKAAYEAQIEAAETVEAVQAALAAAKTNIATKKAEIDAANQNKEPDTPVEPPKKGCKGSVIPSILGLVTLLGACLTLRKKENE